MKHILCSLLLIVIFTRCKPNEGWPKLEGPYLGQQPPGRIPEIFAPGIISTGDNERYASFTPDGKEFFYQKSGRGYTTFILYMNERNGEWQKPMIAFFSGYPEYYDAAPILSPDGKKLVLYSKRPKFASLEPEDNYDIWFVEKIKESWGTPINAGDAVNSPYSDEDATLALNGNLYFSSNRPVDGSLNDWNIFCSRFENGEYKPAELLDSSVNTEHYEGHTFVAPDESYLMYTSSRPGFGDADIWISFRNDDGVWTEGVNLGPEINTDAHEVAPTVSPDGKYLFFHSNKLNPKSFAGKKFTYEEMESMLNSPGNGNGDIYWIDAKIIDELRPL